MKSLVLIAALALVGCGGGGSDNSQPGTNDSAASVSVSPAAVIPISHDYATAGTYTITVTGQYAVTTFYGPDAMQVSLSYSGAGTVTGDAYPTYVVSSNGQTITVNQTVTLVTSGTGPWQMEVICFTGTSAGTMTNLNMHSTPA